MTGGMFLKLVYIASPYAGDIENNVEAAKEYCLAAMEEGVTPVAPHLLYPQFLDDSDPIQRNLGTHAGLELLTRCDELWVCGSEISPGMKERSTSLKPWVFQSGTSNPFIKWSRR